MIYRALMTCLLLFVFTVSLRAEQSIPGPLAQKGELLFADDFARTDLGDWKVIIPGFKVADGVLVGTQDREDHGSVGRVSLPMKDVIMSFRFQLAGSPRFNVVFDDKDHKGSHAGHICRVAIATNQIRLGDDKEGVMRNDIFEMRRDPNQKETADKLLEGRASNAKVSLESDHWYTVEIQILGDRMQVSLDGKTIADLQSPGIGHPTKQSVHFTVSGKQTLFDDVKIWNAKPIALTTEVSAQAATEERSAEEKRPVPDRLVVLTFDDSAKTHFTIVRPLLRKYGFGATFFITEGWDFATNKKDYMSWDEIQQLHRDGFEIGNHTRDHLSVTEKNFAQLDEQLRAIEERCVAHGIPKPVTFAWPGNARTPKAFDILKQHGILFSRRGGEPEYPYLDGRGVAYAPGRDHPFLLPSAGDARPNWELQNFIDAVEQAKDGKIAIMQFHGVPDTAHDWVSSRADRFEAYLHYLATHDFQVIALRDLTRFVDPAAAPADPMQVVEERIRSIQQSDAK